MEENNEIVEIRDKLSEIFRGIREKNTTLMVRMKQ